MTTLVREACLLREEVAQVALVRGLTRVVGGYLAGWGASSTIHLRRLVLPLQDAVSDLLHRMRQRLLFACGGAASLRLVLALLVLVLAEK